jgi:hypothetical protein
MSAPAAPVGHQAIGPDFHVRLARVLGEHVAIDILIAVFKENRLTTISSRRDMVRTAGNRMRAIWPCAFIACDDAAFFPNVSPSCALPEASPRFQNAKRGVVATLRRSLDPSPC